MFSQSHAQLTKVVASAIDFSSEFILGELRCVEIDAKGRPEVSSTLINVLIDFQSLEDSVCMDGGGLLGKGG